MSEISLVKVSQEAPFQATCLFACGLSTGLGAAMYRANVQPGRTVVVFGLGMVGLGAVVDARPMGAERIIGVDLSPQRLQLGRHHGATGGWVADEHIVQRVLDEMGGSGADYTFEATGNVEVMREAVEAERMGWSVATMGGDRPPAVARLQRCGSRRSPVVPARAHFRL